MAATRSIFSSLMPLEPGVHWIDLATKAAVFALMPTFLENTGLMPSCVTGDLASQLFYGIGLLASAETMRRLGSKTTAVVLHIGTAIWGMAHIAFFSEKACACVPIVTTYSELFASCLDGQMRSEELRRETYEYIMAHRLRFIEDVRNLLREDVDARGL